MPISNQKPFATSIKHEQQPTGAVWQETMTQRLTAHGKSSVLHLYLGILSHKYVERYGWKTRHLTSEHLLSESEPELLALLPERGGQQRVAAVEHRHLASVLLPQLGEHLGDNIVTIVTIHWQYFTITEKAPISILA